MTHDSQREIEILRRKNAALLAKVVLLTEALLITHELGQRELHCARCAGPVRRPSPDLVIVGAG